MANSIKKPHPDFPLTPHPTMRWVKKVRGKLHYFGPIVADDGGASAQAALDRWLAVKDDLLAGRTPRAKGESAGPTMRDLANRFLTTKKSRLESNDLSQRTFDDYFDLCAVLIEHFGKDRLLTDITARDFEILRLKWSRTWGPARLGAEVNGTKTIFNFAWQAEMVDKPFRFGEGFARPSKKAMRLHRASQPKKFFEREEILRLLAKAGPSMTAIVLLGLNAGLGNADITHLRLAHLDLERGWLSYPRNKTGVDRRCWLWPETVQAIREWLAVRPQTNGSDIVFLNRLGDAWNGSNGRQTLTWAFRRLTQAAGITGKGKGYYSLRHTFATVADSTTDFVAVGKIMGHERGGIADHYREKLDDSRLQAVAQHVRRWLYDLPAK